MTTQEKFDQILSILPDDGSRIYVTGAPLYEENGWQEHRIKTLRKESVFIVGEGDRFVLRYTTLRNNLNGTIDIYDPLFQDEYEKDTDVLFAWLECNGFFGHRDTNLF